MNFASDNATGAAPEILEALIKASSNAEGGYGADTISRKVEQAFCNIFEKEVAVFQVATGTAANGLALGTLTPAHGAILCHEASHIQTDECGAPEFYSNGAKLLPLSGDAGKITAENLEQVLSCYPDDPDTFVHRVIPKTISITQATECGTVYALEEVRSIAALAQKHGMSLHMDGSRFANALVSLGCTAAEATWKAGVDVLSFGATKNGAVAAEAVIFFDRDKVADFAFRRKRAGHLWSKSRFLGAQLEAYLKDGLWLKLAGHANKMAETLSDGLASIKGVEIVYPVQANEIFVLLKDETEASLVDAGAKFYPWVYPGDAFDGRLRRLVTSYNTSQEDVDNFLRVAGGA